LVIFLAAPHRFALVDLFTQVFDDVRALGNRRGGESPDAMNGRAFEDDEWWRLERWLPGSGLRLGAFHGTGGVMSMHLGRSVIWQPSLS